MRFSYAEAMTDPTFYIPLAKAAEAAGYAGMTIPDSVAYPFESDSKYPYTPDGNREFLDGKAFIETFVLTAALGAVTSTLRFNFFVLKLPIRPPALVAKQVGSLAALIGNRVGLGVGTSPWPEDYQLMGVPFAKRGKRIDECIDIIRGLTTGDYFEYHGEFYDIPKTKMTPAPSQPIPILIGGHADAALRRAARADGWMHGGVTANSTLGMANLPTRTEGITVCFASTTVPSAVLSWMVGSVFLVRSPMRSASLAEMVVRPAPVSKTIFVGTRPNVA